jgi:hypothetical protein
MNHPKFLVLVIELRTGFPPQTQTPKQVKASVYPGSAFCLHHMVLPQVKQPIRVKAYKCIVKRC